MNIDLINGEAVAEMNFIPCYISGATLKDETLN